MEARIVGEQLQSCYRAEGVNHYEACHELAEKYITLLKENRVGLRLLTWKLYVIDQCTSGERLQAGRCVTSETMLGIFLINLILFIPTNESANSSK
jgi:hypothetical protein